jgi:signal transduction histidine kinase
MRPEQVDLASLADPVVAEMQEAAREQGTNLHRTGDTGPLIATVDPTQIAVALKALIQNSLEAVRSGGEIEVLCTQYSVLTDQYPDRLRVDAAHSTCSPSSSVPSPQPLAPSGLRTPHFLLSVRDTGPGIPSSIRPHIFDPFFSGREAGRGLGLGLSKAWRIVEQHGGTIQVESEPGGGATFIIALPQN